MAGPGQGQRSREASPAPGTGTGSQAVTGTVSLPVARSWAAHGPGRSPAVTDKDGVCVESNKVSRPWRVTACVPGAAARTRPEAGTSVIVCPRLLGTHTHTHRCTHSRVQTQVSESRCPSILAVPIPLLGQHSPFPSHRLPLGPKPSIGLSASGPVPCSPFDSSSGHRCTAQRSVMWPQFPVCTRQCQARQLLRSSPASHAASR